MNQPLISRATLSTHHAVSDVASICDLILIDLVAGLSAHGLQLHDTTAPPLVHPSAPLRYPLTQGLVGSWAATNARRGFPVPGGHVDGILYVSRFGANEYYLAVWNVAAPFLTWSSSQPLGAHARLTTECAAIGVVVGP